MHKVASFAIFATFAVLIGWQLVNGFIAQGELADLRRDSAELEVRYKKLSEEFAKQHIELMASKGVVINPLQAVAVEK